ncbi:MAG: hypothetical protein ACYS5V_13010 [Planctomycetota bacterium]
MREPEIDDSPAARKIRADLAVPIILALVAGTATGQARWTKFDMSKADGQGRYLWHEPANWSRGVPDGSLSVEIGDDGSRRPLHCVIAADAVCERMELAEHARTEGTTLRLLKGVTLTFRKGAVMSKDRASTFYVDGTARCIAANTSFRVGGPWGRPEAGLPSACRVVIGPTGTLEAWFVGINTSHRAEAAPSGPWGPKFFSRATDSEVVVKDGRLIVREGLRISTTDSRRPGHLKMHGKASMRMKANARFGVQVWGGVWENAGGRLDIHVGNIEFWGNKFKDAVNTRDGSKVGAGRAVLTVTGDGVSTIHARKLEFVDAAFVDVTGLKVKPGRYVLIDGKQVGKANLKLAAGTDPDLWQLAVDRDGADVILIRKPGEAKPPAARPAKPAEADPVVPTRKGDPARPGLAVFGGGRRLIVVNGYSTSFKWPRILQRKLDRYFEGRRVIEVVRATKGGSPIASWMNVDTGRPLAPWERVRAAMKTRGGRPVIFLGQQSLQGAFGGRAEGIRSPEDTARIRRCADILERYVRLARKEGADLVLVAMHIYKKPLEPVIGHERLALAEMVKRRIPCFRSGPDVWTPTRKLYPQAFAADRLHPNDVGAEVMAQCWFEALLGLDGREIPSWSREEMKESVTAAGRRRR